MVLRSWFQSSQRHSRRTEAFERRDRAHRLLKSCAATYLKEEIQAEALTRNLEGFPRFLFAAVLNGLLGSFELPSDRRGFLFEHLVFNQIRVSASAQEKTLASTGFGHVDFVVELEGQTWAIGAKTGDFSEAAVDATFERARSYLPKESRCTVAVSQREAKKVHNARILSWQTMLR